LSGGAEFAPRHEDDIGKLWQPLDLSAVEKIGGDALDLPPRELLAQARFAEPRHPNDAFIRRRAPGKPRQRRADLSTDPEDDDVAGYASQIRLQGRSWRGHHLFEVRDVMEAVGEYGFFFHGVFGLWKKAGRCVQ